MALFSSNPPTPARPQGGSSNAPLPGTSFFGPNLTFEGTVTGTEYLLIEGTVKGKISVSSELRIGPKARVEATVHARNVTVEGRVKGDISADERVELIATADVEGNLKAPKIVVAEGAKFRGSVDMGSSKPVDSEPARK